MGCGHDGYAGKAEVKYQHGAKTAPYKHTCPMYCATLPEVSRIMRYLSDYKRGSLGNVLHLEAPFLDYLRIAESETAAWEAEMQRQLR